MLETTTRSRAALILLPAATLLAVAALLAIGVGELLAPVAIARSPITAVAAAAPVAAMSAADRGDRAARVLASRLFMPEESSPGPGTPSPGPVMSTDCGHGLRLVGTVSARSASLAAIRGPSRDIGVFRVGDTIDDGTQLSDIGASSVTLARRDGSACALTLFGPPSDPPVLTSGHGAGAPLRQPDELDRLIRQTGPYEYELARELIDRATADNQSLRPSFRVMPHEENGRVVAVKIFGIRDGSALARIGLRNGDAVRTINGFSMADPNEALVAYSRLSHAPELTLALERAGAPLVIRYHVR